MLTGTYVTPMETLFAPGTLATWRNDDTLDARKLLADAEVIVGVDMASGDEHVVFGRDRIEAAAEPIEKILRVGVDERVVGIVALVRGVALVKGRHEYRPS